MKKQSIIGGALYRSAGLIFLQWSLAVSMYAYLMIGVYRAEVLALTLFIFAITNLVLFIPWMIFRELRENKPPVK